jgi:hypothetical protein
VSSGAEGGQLISHESRTWFARVYLDRTPEEQWASRGAGLVNGHCHFEEGGAKEAAVA